MTGFNPLKKAAALMLAGSLLLTPVLSYAEDDDEELSLDELIEEITTEYPDDELWSFPVSLDDMEPELIVLANKQMLLEKTFVVEPLVKLKTRKDNKDGSNANGGVRKCPSSGDLQLSSIAAQALVTMFDDANDQGYKLYLKSAYRSWKTQNTMYYNRLKKNNGKDDGWVAKPGSSDHQTGLGCDVVNYSWRDKSMNSKFAKEKEAQWMAEHCAEYGFIIRYPEDKVDITGINYEPWHLRYVGVPAATYIMENGLCLEEFTEQLRAAIDEFIAAGGSEERVRAFMQESAVY